MVMLRGVKVTFAFEHGVQEQLGLHLGCKLRVEAHTSHRVHVAPCNQLLHLAVRASNAVPGTCMLACRWAIRKHRAVTETVSIGMHVAGRQF